MRFLLPLSVLASSMRAAVIHGCVRDANQGPVVNAAVVLDGQSAPAHTDADGNYRFEKIARGTYSVHVTLSGNRAGFGPFSVDEEETKKVDLVLQPEFFDEPKFAVAGVTTGNYQGGHGSDVILRSADALTKELTSRAGSTEDLDSLRRAIEQHPTDAGLHHRLADAEEFSGHSLDAVHEYQRAAELDPTEPHLFDWGNELLSHRADMQAAEVFTAGNRLHPDSVRMLLGLATAWYARGSYDKAATYFFTASDLAPADISPYILLGKVRAPAITHTPAFVERMGRFARLYPESPQSNYLYAASIWNNRTGVEAAPKVKSLLEKAIQRDPRMSAAWLTLGIVDSDLKQLSQAIEALQRAIEIEPSLEEAHYRLAQVYRLSGQTDRARKELKTFNELSTKSSEQVQRERRELQQFVFSLRTQ